MALCTYNPSPSLPKIYVRRRFKLVLLNIINKYFLSQQCGFVTMTEQCINCVRESIRGILPQTCHISMLIYLGIDTCQLLL
jgi:hypothetical protein